MTEPCGVSQSSGSHTLTPPPAAPPRDLGRWQLRWQHLLEDAEAPCDDRAVAGHAGYLVRVRVRVGLGLGLGLVGCVGSMATVLEASHSLNPAAKWPSRLNTVARDDDPRACRGRGEAPSSVLATPVVCEDVVHLAGVRARVRVSVRVRVRVRASVRVRVRVRAATHVAAKA